MSMGDGLKTTVPSVPPARQSDPPQLKAAKELKPISLRVGDAAEALLNMLMDHVGSFPPPCGPEAVFSILNEDSLQALYKEEMPTAKQGSFRYFALSGSIIVGLLEHCPLDTDQLPTVTAVIRGPFGRHAWTMQLRQLPRNKQQSTCAQQGIRPSPRSDIGQHYNITARYFPKLIDQIPLVKADHSIPPLASVMTSHQDELDKMQTFINQHAAVMEKKIVDKKQQMDQQPFPDDNVACKTPSACVNISTARLFLSSYGFLIPEALKLSQPVQPQLSDLPQLTMLNTSNLSGAALNEELDDMDSMPCRTCDTVHIFYVKTGQCKPEQILSNVSSKQNVSPAFLKFVRSLGWPIDVRKHTGWTGHVSTSWHSRIDNDRNDHYPAQAEGSLYDGHYQVLYWADVLSEIAFIIPSSQTLLTGDRRSSSYQGDFTLDKNRASSVRVRQPDQSARKMLQSVSLDSDHPIDAPDIMRRRVTRTNQSVALIDIRIIVVWLECFEDCDKFPIGDLLAYTSTGQESLTSAYSRQTGETPVHVIFIHPLQNGLFRLVVRGPPLRSGKPYITIPLVDGMVVSHRVMGTLVRQTAINICRRRRLEVESLQTPHGRRKLRLNEIIRKYSLDLSPAEFYTQIFREAMVN